MVYAVIYLDPVRRIKLYREGGYQLEMKVEGLPGWVLQDEECWEDEIESLIQVRDLINKHLTDMVGEEVEAK